MSEAARPLSGRVAVVAGASRGAGRGIAVVLGEAGATVYVAGRTVRDGERPIDGALGNIDETADEVTARGGLGVPVRADLTVPEEVTALFAKVSAEQGRLDILANAVWGGNERYREIVWGAPFWEQPIQDWDSAITAGLYAYLLTSRAAARLMAPQGAGLIVEVCDGVMADGSRPYYGPLVWDLAHSAIERMTLGMSQDLKPQGVAVVALMPGFMRTERVVMLLTTEKARQAAGFDRTESTEYLGRGVAALAADANVLAKTGELHFVADLAREYGFTDIDGKQPPRFAPTG